MKAGNVLAVSKDHVLTASWQACNVIFFGTDDVEFKTPITVTDGKYPTLPVITRTGLNFVGWSYNGTQVKAGDKIESSEYEIRLIPIWESKLAVFFDSGYELFIPTVYVEGTQVYPTLPTLERPGYEFGGWYYGTTPISSGSALLSSKSHCIRAKWTEIKGNTVKLEANGGTCSTDTLFALEGESVTLPTPTRVGHSFSGWYTAATGGTKIGGAGASYTPTSNITLYAQWTPYKVTFNANGGSCSTSSSNAGEDGKVTLPTPTRSGYDFNGWFTATSGGTKIGGAGETYTPTSDITLYAQWSSCVTGDTLITLADGTQVRVDSLRGDELLLVWNMQTGSFDFAPIMFVDSDPEAMLEIINLHFSDGTVVRVIYEHGFWDYDLNRYVYLDANSEAYIGHYFAKQNGDTLERVQLTDVTVTTELTTAWSPVTVGHLCYFVNGMLSMPGGVGGLFNIFEVNPETMAYDEEAMLRDIEAYGLFTYEELNAIAPLSEEMFEAAGGAYMKISIAKGNLTMEELISMIERYSRFFS